MKKLGLVFVAVVMTASFAKAQFRVGPQVGFNLSNVSIKYDDKDMQDLLPDNKMRLGLNIGALAEIGLSDILAVQAAVQFSQLGYKWDSVEEQGTDDEYESTWKARMNYIQVPINAQLVLGKFYLQAGPYLGFGIGGMTRSKVKGDITGLTGLFTPDDYETFGDESGMKKFDFGVGFGLGLKLSKFQFGLGYNLGLVNIADSNQAKARNSAFSLNFALLFGGGK